MLLLVFSDITCALSMGNFMLSNIANVQGCGLISVFGSAQNHQDNLITPVMSGFLQSMEVFPKIIHA